MITLIWYNPKTNEIFETQQSDEEISHRFKVEMGMLFFHGTTPIYLGEL